MHRYLHNGFSNLPLPIWNFEKKKKKTLHLFSLSSFFFIFSYIKRKIPNKATEFGMSRVMSQSYLYLYSLLQSAADNYQ